MTWRGKNEMVSFLIYLSLAAIVIILIYWFDAVMFG